MYIVNNIYLIIHDVCRDLSWLDISFTRTNSSFLSYRCLFTLSYASFTMIHVFERKKNEHELEGFCVFKKEVKGHGNITYPYLAILRRVDARNCSQQDLSWHAGSLRGNIFNRSFHLSGEIPFVSLMFFSSLFFQG